MKPPARPYVGPDMTDAEFEAIVPRRTDGKKNKIPRHRGPLPHMQSFGEVVRDLRKLWKGTPMGKEFDRVLRERGLLKNGRLRGRAAQK